MSNNSSEILGLIHVSIERIIQELSTRLNNYGAYTYDSIDVRYWKNALIYYTSLENFLDEYAEGNEEIDFEELYTVVKIALSSVSVGGGSVETTNILPKPGPIGVDEITLHINGVNHGGLSPFAVNEDDIIDLVAEYNGTLDVQAVRISVDTISVTEESSSVKLENYKVNYSGSSLKNVVVLVYIKDQETPLTRTFHLEIISDEVSSTLGFPYIFPLQLS
jgi:hypothetical protein